MIKENLHLHLLEQQSYRQDLSLSTIGRYHRHSVERMQFDVHAFGLIVEGEGLYKLDESQEYRQVRPGSLIFVWPGQYYLYGPEHRSWKEYYLSFKGPSAKDRLRSLGADRGVIQLQDWQGLVHRWEELITILNRQQRDIDRALAMAERLMAEIYLHREDHAQDFTRDSRCHDALRYLETHYEQLIDLQDLAEQFGMSYSLFRLRAKEITGIPPSRYLCQLRCQQAARLLVESPDSIQSIALSVGMEDAYSFSRAFKREMGSSPKHYRESFMGRSQ